MVNEVKLKLAIEGASVVKQEIGGVNASIGQMASGAVTAAKAMAGVFAGFAATQTIGKLISVQREFDVLNSSLITVTGSSAKAAQEFAWIKQFAATTPYQLNEVTGAFVKMKALGLDASQKALTSYGNTASAMGKNLNQMIEAVADASTGEFERLEGFGIKANKQGNDVSMTFQGVTKTIGNNASEITGYLQAIGNNEFASAMTTRAATLDGAISNLTDTWDALFLTISTNNAGGLIYDSVTVASAAIKDATTVLNALSGAASTNAKDTGAMATVQEAMAVTFERVTIGAATVKMFLVQVGESLGALAAIAVQAVQGNWEGVKAIVDEQRSSSRAALDELSTTTVRILGARQAVTDAAKAQTAADAVNAQSSARMAHQGAEAASATVKAHTTVADAAKAAAEAAKGLAVYNDLMAKDNGLAANFEEQAISLSKAKLSTEQLTAAMAVLVSQQPFMQEAEKMRLELAKENTKAVDDLFEAQEKLRLKNEDSIKTSRTMLEQIEFETRLLEMNAEQRAQATMERELERQGIVKGTLAYDDYIAKLREAMSIKTGKEAGIKAADDLREAQKKAAEESGKYWEDALMRAFESGKGFFQSLWDTIKNTLKTQVLKVMVQGVMGTLGVGASGAAMAGGTGGGLMGTLSIAQTLKGVYDMASKGIASSVASLSGSMQGAADWMMTSSSDLIAGLGESLSANVGSISTGLGTLGVALAGVSVGSMLAGNKVVLGMDGTTTSVIGSAIGYALTPVLGPLGPLIGGALGGLTNALFGHGPTEVQSQGTRGTFASGGTFSGYNYANLHQEGGWFSSDRNWTQTSAIDAKTVNAWQTAFVGVKTSVAQMAISVGLSTDAITSYSKYIDIAAGTTAEQLTAVFTGMADDMASSAMTAWAMKDLPASLIADAQKNGQAAAATITGTFGQALAKSVLLSASPIFSSMLGKFAGGVLGAVATSVLPAAAQQAAAARYAAQFAKEGETASVTFQRLTSSLALTNQWLGQFNDTLLATSLTAGDQASKLIDGFGGADKFTSAQASYYQTMYTEEERLADTTLNVAKGLALVNVAMPTTLAAYNKLRNAQDVMTESGRNAYTVMTLLGPEFAQVASAAAESVNTFFDTLTKRLDTLQQSIASERESVAGARSSILNGGPKTYAQLDAGVTAAQVVRPSNAAAVSATTALAKTGTAKDKAQAALDKVAPNYERAVASLAKTTAKRDADALALATAIKDPTAKYLADYNDVASNEYFSGRAWEHYVHNGYYEGRTWGAATTGETQLAMANEKDVTADTNWVNGAKPGYTKAFDASTLANAAYATAQTTAYTALLAYTAAMTQYSGDAEKAVKVLGTLREETVAYYEAQKELANTMATSAATLREAVRATQFGQLSASNALASQQKAFATSYSMALSTSGAAKAGYADKMGAALPELSTALMNASSTRAEWVLATSKLYSQSETIASQLAADATGMNYEAESLDLLGDIDLTLNTLATNTTILKNAIESGTSATTVGLRAIVTQLGGTPAFAGGGSHSGGIRIVGENGPELEVTGPSHIYNQAQLKRMAQGGAGGTSNNSSADLAAVVLALTRKMDELQREMRQMRTDNNTGNAEIINHTQKTRRINEKWDAIGIPATQAA